MTDQDRLTRLEEIELAHTTRQGGRTSKRLRELAEELGYRGGKTIYDDFVRELRPRYLPRRTFQRTAPVA